jgi:hypothetical protein
VTVPTGTLIIDAANVVGSRPDGWWRDRLGAAERLRDEVAGLAPGAAEVVLVVEGAARGVREVPGVRVVSAPGSGDDTIVALAAEATGDVTVVTADRGLRERVAAVGAQVVGPSTLRGWLASEGRS